MGPGDGGGLRGRRAGRLDAARYVDLHRPLCVRLRLPKVHDRLRPSWERRRQLFRDCPNLVAVAPSRWMARQAAAGIWANRRVVTIANGVPTDVYRPVDRQESRRALGLSARGPVVLVAAQDLTERRKGATLFPYLWRHVTQPLSLLTMGEGTLPGQAAHALGFVADERRKVLAYNAADVLLHPAPVDNLPNVILEAMACGTPAVGMPVGGVPELIVPGKTGWLAKEATSAALGQALDQALGDIQANVNLRTACRVRAERDFSSKRQAERHEILYRETTGGPASLAAG
jgi:glycosyltransferase involved in cell wall biosynthesis